MSDDLNYSLIFCLYGPHPAIHTYARYAMQEGASGKELQPFQHLLSCLPRLTVQPRNYWRSLSSLPNNFANTTFTELSPWWGWSKKEELGSESSWRFQENCNRRRGCKQDHSASEHPSTLIIISGMLFMMLEAKHRLMYLVRWEPYVIL